jgi:hypothetical protein
MSTAPDPTKPEGSPAAAEQSPSGAILASEEAENPEVELSTVSIREEERLIRVS